MKNGAVEGRWKDLAMYIEFENRRNCVFISCSLSSEVWLLSLVLISVYIKNINQSIHAYVQSINEVYVTCF